MKLPSKSIVALLALCLGSTSALAQNSSSSDRDPAGQEIETQSSTPKSDMQPEPTSPPAPDPPEGVLLELKEYGVTSREVGQTMVLRMKRVEPPRGNSDDLLIVESTDVDRMSVLAVGFQALDFTLPWENKILVQPSFVIPLGVVQRGRETTIPIDTADPFLIGAELYLQSFGISPDFEPKIPFHTSAGLDMAFSAAG